MTETKNEKALRKLDEIQQLSTEVPGGGIGWLAAAVGWLIKDRLEQLLDEAIGDN